MHQQQDDMATKWKKDLNIAYTIALIHQRAIIIPLRRSFGVRALGGPCALALLLMCTWAALSKDLYMWLWIALWMVCFVMRRVESLKLARSIHSEYDGWPQGTIRIGRTEYIAKRFVEPALIAAFGGCVYWLYTQYHLSPYGLPYFLLAGGVTLTFVAMVNQQVWERRMQSMKDARIEQEAMVNEIRKRGDL